LVKTIFSGAQTKLRKPSNLRTLTTNIDGLDWFSARKEGLGDLYEGLLEKNANEKKSGAGQYFTPRPLIDCLVRLMKPAQGEVIQDPAAGTAGFLVAAHNYICALTDDLEKLSSKKTAFQRNGALYGIELVPDTHRLAVMNLMLHGIDGSILSGDALTEDGTKIPSADLILTNPPFGTKKGGGKPSRRDFSITTHTSNKQLAFIEHVVRALKPGGRAAVILPDNVLFEGNTARALRTWMMDLCNVHTILRLPTGIFYAQGVRTNVVFLTRGQSNKKNTSAVWIYDMRSQMPGFGKTRLMKESDFLEFEAAFGTSPSGRSRRRDEGPTGRFRRFTREEIATRDDNLDVSWLSANGQQTEQLSMEAQDIAAAIIGHLRSALAEIEQLSKISTEM
jgi:type I restriction enzyme M protein